MKFGLSLSNRAVALGNKSAREVLRLARLAEESGEFDSVWVGDALLVNPRLESVALLSAIAAVTDRVLLGTACMGSFALRNPVALALQWASLDQISDGRTRLIACAGGGAGPLWEAEATVFGVRPAERRAKIVEHVRILRRLWSEDHVTFEGDSVSFTDVTTEPKPLQQPCPIWLATNATKLSSGKVAGAGHALVRVGKFFDGWMTHSVSPEVFAHSWETILGAAREAGRDTATFDNCLYHNINVSCDDETALAEANTYLEVLYGSTFTPERTRAWCTVGDPESCIKDLRRYADCGVQRITLRLCSDNQEEQLNRLVTEVLPFI
jgi:alkanesulfonate monooxygenase SsuD/methylene tetrahydromethanopterin reductase-like flavin-dependent oxidoreductase (luciferase family)